MSFILFDPEHTANFYPLTINKSVAELQVGVYTLKQWWEKNLNSRCYIISHEYVAGLYEPYTDTDILTYINAAAFPNYDLTQQINNLRTGEALVTKAGVLIALKTNNAFQASKEVHSASFKSNLIKAEILSNPVQLLKMKEELIRLQFKTATDDKISQKAEENNLLLSKDDIFIEDGCSITGATLNAKEGPIYISKNVIIMEGSCLRGPLFLGEGCVVKMGTKIYGATAIGKKCILGGEIKNIVMHNYSNKAHDGYLGDSVIGSWCNFGAGTSCSNLKNTAGNIELYNYASDDFILAGTKCGVIMGDYSRTAINTSINSGTSVGICCNLVEPGLSEKVYKNFSWGNRPGHSYRLPDAIKHVNNWMHLKNQQLSVAEEKVLMQVYQLK